jgi:hypothetical protein
VEKLAESESSPELAAREWQGSIRCLIRAGRRIAALAAIEHIFIDDAGKVEQRAGEAIHLVDHNAVGASGANVGEELLERGAVHVGAGIAAVIVVSGRQRPAFGTLAGDEGLGGITLRIEGVEVLFETFFGGLAGVNGAIGWTALRAQRRMSGC